jgi:hypothetical protein
MMQRRGMQMQMQIQYKKHKINAKNRTDVMNSVSEKNKQI